MERKPSTNNLNQPDLLCTPLGKTFHNTFHLSKLQSSIKKKGKIKKSPQLSTGIALMTSTEMHSPTTSPADTAETRARY